MSSIYTALNEKISKQQQQQQQQGSDDEQKVFYFTHQPTLDQAVVNRLSHISNQTDVSTQMDEVSMIDNEKKTGRSSAISNLSNALTIHEPGML